MKKIPRWLNTIFGPKELYGLDIKELLDAMNDSGIRKLWIYEMLQELKRLSLEIDKRLLANSTYSTHDLAVRRKAFQDVFEGILSAKRQVRNHNPKSMGEFDLESVTVGPAYL